MQNRYGPGPPRTNKDNEAVEPFHAIKVEAAVLCVHSFTSFSMGGPGPIFICFSVLSRLGLPACMRHSYGTNYGNMFWLR